MHLGSASPSSSGAVLHTHVDDCLVASDEKSDYVASVLNKAKSQLHMLQKDWGDFVYTGKRIRRCDRCFEVTQTSAVISMDSSSVKRGANSVDDPLPPELVTTYMSIVGQFLYVANGGKNKTCVK